MVCRWLVVGGWLLVVGAAAQSSEAGLVEGDAKPQASKIWAHSYSGMHDRLESSMAMRIAGLYCTLSTCEGQGVAGYGAEPPIIPPALIL